MGRIFCATFFFSLAWVFLFTVEAAHISCKGPVSESTSSSDDINVYYSVIVIQKMTE